jgi:hypothetical protein
MRRRIIVLMTAVACAVLAAGPASAATTWTVQATPREGVLALLRGVSCPSATSCMAVGSGGSNGTGALAEQWNGSTWAALATPKPANALLWAVSCPSVKSCMAVGQGNNSAADPVALTEQWNGSTWKIVPNPADATAGTSLAGVSCTSATSCTAVGNKSNGGEVEKPLAERWNGSTWAIQAAAVPANVEATWLNAVSCVSATSCTAVGADGSGSTSYFVLAEHWNGSTWSVQQTPNVAGGSDAALNGISCSSATSCVTVGVFDPTPKVMAERWNGSTWTIMTMPKLSGPDWDSLNGVSCTSSTACTATGFTGFGDSLLVEGWNGSTWTVQAAPNPKGSASDLDAVWCVSSATCTAVGGDAAGTLAERS